MVLTNISGSILCTSQTRILMQLPRDIINKIN